MRNFLYNKSDILIAVVIIVVAIFIIWTRVDAIMDDSDTGDAGNPVTTEEPGTTAEGDAPTDGGEETPVDGETPVDSGEETPVDGETLPDGEAPDDDGEEAPADGGEAVSFTIEVGSAASTVADNLAGAGLVETADDFLSELKAQGAETKLKAGNFDITPGTSVSDIVKKLTS
jgi:hypothetical protein